jgi:hypothetical protein
MSHDSIDRHERSRARFPGGADGRRVPRTRDAETPRATAGERSATDDDGPDPLFAIATSELFSGPVASPRALREYETIVPGAARQLIDCHLRSEAVAADAVERLSRAETAAVVVGTIGAQVLTFGALGAAVLMVVNGHTTAAIAAVVPGVLSAAAQVISAVRRPSE